MVERALTLGRISEACLPWRLKRFFARRSSTSVTISSTVSGLEPLLERDLANRRRLRGHFQYFGVNGNARSLRQGRYRTERLWLKWLQRRSQRGHRMTWERFDAYLKAHPLPPARISVQIWANAP